jgi:chemotaxis response regulator CheB
MVTGPVASGETNLKPLAVLVVDDDASIRMLVRIALSVEDGFGEVREATNGREAIEICESFAPDVVVLDFWMPEVDGAQTAALIKASYPGVRIVAFSGVIEGKPDWADSFMVKGRAFGLNSLVSLARTA